VEIAQALALVALRDIHLPNGRHLNARRVPVPPMPRRRRKRRDEIQHWRAILSLDLREDLALAMDSEWWDHPS
jgi:hypothetical protein